MGVLPPHLIAKVIDVSRRSANRILCLVGMLTSDALLADPAIRLLISNDFCLIQPCGPHLPPPTVVAAGTSFGIYVAAVSEHALDTGYVGTIRFVSSDPLAILPANYTFVADDRGDRAFEAILRTPGEQTITVTDLRGTLIPGTLTMTVTSQALAQPVPVTSGWAISLLAVSLALAGLWFLRGAH